MTRQTLDIYANRYSAGDWGTATLIDTGIGGASNPQVAMDDSGNAVAVWDQSIDNGSDIYSNQYSAGAWGRASLMESDAGGAQLAFGGNGSFVAVFEQNHDSTDGVYSSRYSAGAWGAATFIGNGPESEEVPQVAVDASGNAVAVWIQGNYPQTIYANSYAAKQL